MTRILGVNDIHLSDRPPSLRTDTYAEDILSKLWWTVRCVKENHLDAVVWTGDVFHVKAPSRTSHLLVQDTVEVGQAYGVPWYIVPGNHDIQYDRLDSIDRQPLGVLFQAGARPLDGWATGLPLFGVPWLRDWQHELPRYAEMFAQRVPLGMRGNLIATHAPIIPSGDKPFEVILAGDWAEMFNENDTLYGHMHDPDGIYPVGGAHAWFCNPGALSRGSLHEATLARKPSVAVWTDEPTGECPFSIEEVPHRPVEEVFRLDVKEREEVRQARLDEFLSGVERTELVGLSVEQVLAAALQAEMSPPTYALIQEVLEEVMSR